MKRNMYVNLEFIPDLIPKPISIFNGRHFDPGELVNIKEKQVWPTKETWSRLMQDEFFAREGNGAFKSFQDNQYLEFTYNHGVLNHHELFQY